MNLEINLLSHYEPKFFYTLHHDFSFYISGFNLIKDKQFILWSLNCVLNGILLHL